MLTDDQRAILARVAKVMRDGVERVLFVTGAGVSADSGLPTYRGIGGLYDDRHTDDGMPIERALSGAMLHARPEVTWRYIHQIEAACRGASPNRGHEVIAALQARYETVVLTQNVDGLHQAGGARDVIDIHGDIHDLMCTSLVCAWADEVADYAALAPLPRCPRCDAVLRPGVVLFGEMLPVDRVDRLQDELERGFDIVFSVGTTSVFPYIAGPVIVAAQRGRPTVEINPGRSQVTGVVRYRIDAGAAESLDALHQALEEGA